jgi:hypothetical protein
MSSSVKYIKDNKQKYDDFKIIKNNLVIIPPDSIKESNILPIITNISYDKDGKVNLDNFIYHYLQSEKGKYYIIKNNPKLDIINKTYKNIIIYKKSGNKYNCYILNGSTITDLFKFKSDDDIYNSIRKQKNNCEEYYLNYKKKKEETKEEYIRFKIFISLIIIPVDDENLIIFDYYESSPFSPLIISQNIVAQDVSITNTEFENLNKLVITKAIYEDNPFDYLSEPQQS